MAWVDEDFGHEGYVCHRFADGMTGSASTGTGSYATTTTDGAELPYDSWVLRPSADVTGWVPMCSCGWQGQPWMRVFEMLEEDADARTAFDEYALGDPPPWVEERIHLEWLAHLATLHDPLCPVRTGGVCACAFIAEVREDERRRT